MRLKKLSWAFPSGFVAVLCAAAALAHGGATGIVAERMEGMMMLGEQTKLLSEHFNGTTVLDTPDLAGAAKMIAGHSGAAITDKFPENSLDAPSEARAEIWENWEIFLQFADELKLLAAELELALVAQAAPREPDEVPQPDEWEQLTVEVLLGLKSRAEVERERQESAGEAVPERRAPEVILVDITRNCGACHERFRL